MTPIQLTARLIKRPLLLDGALGTMLMSMGLDAGVAPESWILAHPNRIREAHQRYAHAGSDVVHTVTFGGTPTRLACSGIKASCKQINSTAVALAKEACGSALVAGDIGPTGLFCPPSGNATEQELEKEFRAQVSALVNAGVDLLSIETMYDEREALAALRAAKGTGLAVLCCMTFQVKQHGMFTFMGNALIPALTKLIDAGATAVGFNCSVTSDVMLGMVRKAKKAIPNAFLIAQANAGQPITTPSGTHYHAEAGKFADDVQRMLKAGARIVGGCCGTDDSFIRAMRERIDVLVK